MTDLNKLPKILIVDDKAQNLYVLDKLLRKLEVQVFQATRGSEALALTLEHEFCLAIVDVQMPEMDGYELVELLRGNPSTATLPVIFVSAIYSDEYHHRKGYDTGAVDFMSKPFIPEILLSKVRVFLDLYRQRVKLQELVDQVNEVNGQLTELNATKDKLFSIVAHDLRGPFNPLLGLAEILTLTADTSSLEEIKEMAGSIYRSAKTVHNLLENLLQWSRLERGRIEYEPTTVQLQPMVEQTVDLFATNAAEKSIHLQSIIPEEMSVYADKAMLDTVIRNLTSNALKFTPTNGQITISADPNNLTSGFVELEVADTGVGISQEDLAKLFKTEAHHTTRGTDQEQGTGLGLIICKEMVKRNGGQIWVESEVGQGTTVKFTVPVSGRSPKTNGSVQLDVDALDAVKKPVS